MFSLEEVCKKSRNSIKSFVNLNEKQINAILKMCTYLIYSKSEYIKEENRKDVELAKQNGKSPSFIDRLLVTDSVINSMVWGNDKIIKSKSPTDKIVYKYHNKKQKIKIVEKTVPFGVIGIIYEARPNVTVDAFTLCFKTKNAVILKGGSDAINTNIAIANCIKEGLRMFNVDENAITVIEDTSRETTIEFMKMNRYIDLLIPRGSANLIKTTVENATIPLIETGSGNCHIYVDEFANIDKAVKIILNAKTQRYSVCNACESLVIHSNILEKALPKIAEALQEKNVEIRCDERSIQYVDGGIPATFEDFYTEYVDGIISVKTVDSLDEAIAHINEHSTRHSESIITENSENAIKFQNEVDSSTVYVNASTRFTDGFIFGLGAEVGISTQKLHARGPMGLNALVTTKFYVNGNGAIRK